MSEGDVATYVICGVLVVWTAVWLLKDDIIDWWIRRSE